MKLHFVRIPTEDSGPIEEELNRFLGTHRIVSVDRHLVADGARSAWAICVTYVDADAGREGAPFGHGTAEVSGKKLRVDYREVLPDAEFQIFARLRDLRKQLAERDSVPPYAVFTNEQLAAMVRGKARTAADLHAIDGIGPARLEKYGRPFLDVLKTAAAADLPPAPVEAD